MKFTVGAFACALTMSAPALQAQTAPVTTAATTSGTLRAGTSVPLKMSEPLTTLGKKLKVGQRFQLETAENVMIDGNVVIPAGSPATGEVTEVRNKGMWGKSGRINGRVLYVRANGRQIRMSGQLDDKGTTGTAAVVGSLVIIPIAGFFMTGTSANIPLGTPVTAFIDEDVSVAFSGTAAPMVVAPAAVVPVATPVTLKK
ncbi:hypothetical protein ASE82_10930 [Sphingomonas sp. Leaf230]|uniref:hypothetical protein n=1 Tax=Sphingomonas sp. Leaf230 TaxID=1735694 RepID=UPI0006F617E9|nr:hypothetical protein [Sphingomonas sp. Leaf230]KQN02790.1 hypothetical protein ASE82_10930 [Sphingomonas sp. Leaf230]